MLWGDGRRTELGPEKSVLVAPEMILGMRQAGRMRQLYTHFVVAPPFHCPLPRLWEVPADESRQAMCQSMYNQIASGQGGRALELRALAWVTAALAAVPVSDWTKKTMDERVHAAMREVEQRLVESLPVERMARWAGMSTAAFARLFRSETGKTPHRFVQERRLALAARLLEQRSSSIDEVAEQSGFCDRYAFSKAFIRFHGLSPAAYRRRGVFGAGDVPKCPSASEQVP